MTRLLVTGADGFVGRHLVRAARATGISVVAAVGPGGVPPEEWQSDAAGPLVEVIHGDLTLASDVAHLGASRPDAVVHLAAMASGNAARQDPDGAFRINGAGSVLLFEALRLAGARPRFLLISTGEVYGPGHDGPIAEDTPVNPVSAYAASKWAAEEGLMDLGAQDGNPVIVARPFPHTGPGQSPVYVLPALAERMLVAKRAGAHHVKAGNLDAIRDFLDVRDVVQAYLALLDRGEPGTCYNVASGTGQRLSDCFAQLAKIIGVAATPNQDAELMRPADIPVLIGDASKLRSATGWAPQYSFERTLQDLVDAQAH